MIYSKQYHFILMEELKGSFKWKELKERVKCKSYMQNQLSRELYVALK